MEIPDTLEKWEAIKKQFLEIYKVEDAPETWTFVLSQLQNVKMPELEFSAYDIWAHYKRWKIAKVLQDAKTVYIGELEAKLKEKLEALAKQEAETNGSPSPAEHPEHMSSGAFYSEGDVPALPTVKEGMV